MTNKTRKDSEKQKSGANNAKLLITAASITITMGGALALLGEQLATPAATTSEQASASGITVTYMTPATTPTTDVDFDGVAVIPTLIPEPTIAPSATTTTVVEPTAEPTDLPTDVPTVEPTVEPTVVPTLEPTPTQVVVQVQRPPVMARSRSSR